jgi:RNA polymerase sigma factor (sigma-70 family)
VATIRTSQAAGVLARLLTETSPDVEQTDGDLVRAFVERKSPAAFRELVLRHGSMVLGVCLRMLRNRQDAEDAFQATFLVLARKAGSVSPPNAVGNWLHGVAFQTAVRARAITMKRRRHETVIPSVPETATWEAGWDDVAEVLDEELRRLPNHYRAVLLLCDVEGRTRADAARHLGCPEGSVSSRLSRARAMLAMRLTKRGVTLPAGAVALLVGQNAITAGVPKALVTSTVESVGSLAAGSLLASGISTTVATLTEGILKTMLLKKIMSTTMVVLALGMAVITCGSLAIGQTKSTGKPVDAKYVKQPAAEKPVGPEVKQEKEAFTAWGKEIGGLQAGLGFKAGEKRVYTHGETVTLVVRVRNVGKAEVTFQYLRQFFIENPPTVLDEKGKQVSLGRSTYLGSHIPVDVNLAVGMEIELYERRLELGSGNEKGIGVPKSSVLYGTGKFQVQYKKVLAKSSSGGVLKLDPVLSKLATGKLELEVKEPEKMPPEKKAITESSHAKAAPVKPKPNYVTVVGQLLDDATGQSIEKAGWEWGMADPKKPEQIAWGHSRQSGGNYPGGKFEMLVNIGANGHHYPLRVYSAGYETTIVVDDLAKPYPEKIERIVRLKRGRNITGVLRDHEGKPVANGWIFFIPKGHRTNIVEGIPGTDAYELPGQVRDGAVAEVRTNANGTFALFTGTAGTLAASTDLVDLWPFPLLEEGQADFKMPAPSYLVIDLTYWYLDELAKKGQRELSPNSEDPNQCWLAIDREWSVAEAKSGLGYRRQMLVFAKEPRAKLSKGVIVGHVNEGEMPQPIPGVGHNKNLSTKIRVALPAGSYRVQRLRAGPFAPVAEQQVVLMPGEDTVVSWARGDGSSVRGKATWPANLMFVRQPGEKPRKLDWTVPDTATVWIAPVGADGKASEPIEAAKIQPDGSFFIATHLDPGKYKATARVYLPEGDFRGGLRTSDCNYSQELTVPDPVRGPFGSPPLEVEIKMNVGAGGRFVATDSPAVPAKP